MTPIQWQPDSPDDNKIWPMPPLFTAIGRGLLGRCPACGNSHLFNGFLRVRVTCQGCAAPLGLARADDAPPYFTIMLVGHLLVPTMLMVDRAWAPEIWLMTMIFVPMAGIMSVGLLRPIKGGTVGLMMKLNILKTHMDEV